jgi:hypothetical protein
VDTRSPRWDADAFARPRASEAGARRLTASSLLSLCEACSKLRRMKRPVASASSSPAPARYESSWATTSTTCSGVVCSCKHEQLERQRAEEMAKREGRPPPRPDCYPDPEARTVREGDRRRVPPHRRAVGPATAATRLRASRGTRAHGRGLGDARGGGGVRQLRGGPGVQRPSSAACARSAASSEGRSLGPPLRGPGPAPCYFCGLRLSKRPRAALFSSRKKFLRVLPER